jgi:hypothetical protein
MSYTDADTSSATRAVRHDGWTNARQLEFLEALAAHGHVERAAQRVGMTASTAYRLRGRSGAFERAWQAASAMAYYRLRDLAMERIDTGETTTHYYHGEVVATRTRFSDRLLVAMLDHLKPAPLDARVPRAVDPSLAYTAAIDAYVTAEATGGEPKVPIDDGTGKPPMTREEFIAIIEARPHPDDYDRAWDTTDGADHTAATAGHENDFSARA